MIKDQRPGIFTAAGNAFLKQVVMKENCLL